MQSNVQYFSLKYGFQPKLEARQLKTIKLIFKIEELGLPVTNVREGVKWETVGIKLQWAQLSAFKFLSEGIKTKHPVLKNFFPQPDDSFLSNIEDYRYNRFLYIGKGRARSTMDYTFYFYV